MPHFLCYSRLWALSEALQDVISHAEGIRGNRERWINRTSRTEKRSIDHVEIIDIVGSAVQIKNGRCRIFAKATGAALVSNAFEWDGFMDVERSRNNVRLVIDLLQYEFPRFDEPVKVLMISIGDVKLDLSFAINEHAVIGTRQIFRCQPPVDGMRCDLLEGHAGHERKIGFQHRAIRFAQQLNMPHRPRKIFASPIKIIHRKSLLKSSRIWGRRDAEHGAVLMTHVIAANLVRRIGDAGRVIIGCAAQEECRRIDRPRRDNNKICAKNSLLAIDLGLHSRNFCGMSVGEQSSDPRVRQKSDIGKGQCGTNAVHVGVALAIDEARKSIAGVAPDTGASVPIDFIQFDREGAGKRRSSRSGEIVQQFLNTGLVRDGWKWVGRVRGGFSRIAATQAVNFIQRLCFGIVPFKVTILQRPFRRDSALVLDPLEVPLAQSEHGGSVNLGVSPYIVARPRAEFFPVLIPPHFRRMVALVLEDLDRTPIGFLSGKIAASLENQDSRATWRQALSQGAAPSTCTNNDDIEGFVRHAKTVSRWNGSLFRLTLVIILSCFSGFGVLQAGGVQITSIQETVSNGEKLSSFYTDVLEFKRVEATKAQDGIVITLRLGEETLLLYAPDKIGRPIPADMTSNDLGFQHLAIVVSDIDAAYQRLLDHGVTIVSSGPQTLPDSNYDAAQTRALYFRDPDGHFLELIEFPSNKGEPKWHDAETLFLGIDHSAIAVRDTKESRDFYRDRLGLTNEGDSLNYGIEQERLSGVAGAQVEITSFKGAKGPGIELLQYKKPGIHETDLIDVKPNDLLHWQINLQGTPKPAGSGDIRDPNGHALSVNPIRISSQLTIAGEALRLHWTRYLMEGAELGIFMVVALYLTILLEHPHSFLRRKLKSDLLRRFILGIGIGSTVILLIYCQWGRQSGAQFNPAVTLARLSLSRIEPWDAFFYIVAQFIGGWLLLAIAGLPFRHKANHDDVNWVVTEPGETGTVAAFVAEFFISFLIFFSLLVTYHSPTLRPWIGFVAGLHLCLFITFEAPFSGMSLNPARTVASAVPARSWMALWLYFVAPPVAMVLAAQLCRWLFDS